MAECVPTPEPLDQSDEEPLDEFRPLVEETEDCPGSTGLEGGGSYSKYVKLNVGGSLFTTTLGTLMKQDNMLRAMFSGRMEVHTDEEGWVLIDRSGKHFGLILNFLRDGSVPLPELKKECLELLAESKFYLIEELTDAIEIQLAILKKSEYEPGCRVPVITSPEEEHLIVSSSCKPLVKLLYNRGSNKYSYTPNSDDNLLKNIELFDKLSVRFCSRIKFIKDIVGRGEICCWAFYGRARKVAEVCCESIVYATDRKHTKIEFPEAKILEETLNIMLYEGSTKRGEEASRAAHIEAISRTRRNRTPDGFLSDDQNSSGGGTGATGGTTQAVVVQSPPVIIQPQN